MIFSKELLFIHVPKTGGMSVSKYLLETLPRPLYYVHPPHDEGIRDSGVVEIVGNRHLPLTAARDLLRSYKLEVGELRLLFAVIRNPYAVEVSRYAYLQTGRPWDAGPNQELALTSDFETFAIKSSLHGGSGPIEDYFLLDGTIPANMRLVRFENLADEVIDALRSIGIKCDSKFPHINQSRHGDFRSYYTQAAEEAVYRRYRWVFDNRLYERLDVKKCSQFASHHVHRLPISGPVRQVGTSFGFMPDGWVGRTLQFKVTAEQPINRISIQGWVPDRNEAPVDFMAAVNGAESCASFERGQSFKWDLGCNVRSGGTVAVTLSSSDTWCPKAVGASQDERELSFRLATVAFERHQDNGGLEVNDLVPLVVDDAKDNGDESRIAELAAQIGPFAWPPLYEEYFQFWEGHGFHLTPVHFYQPIPDTRQLPEELWERESAMPGVDMNDAVQLKFLTEILPQFQSEYTQFPKEPTEAPHEFYFDNPMFSGTDALALYGMIRHFRPQRIVEVGSGFSSRMAAKALTANGTGELVCIEPYPQEVLRNGFPRLKQLIKKEVQRVGLEVFQDLGAHDLLFIDSSHVVRVDGDVNFLFLEVLPRLKPGVLVHVHDIYLPLPGRRDWVMQERRFWNEQELLQAFLAFNREFEVLLANAYAARKYNDQMKAAFPSSPWWGGGSFWMRRRTES